MWVSHCEKKSHFLEKVSWGPLSDTKNDHFSRRMRKPPQVAARTVLRPHDPITRAQLVKRTNVQVLQEFHSTLHKPRHYAALWVFNKISIQNPWMPDFMVRISSINCSLFSGNAFLIHKSGRSWSILSGTVAGKSFPYGWEESSKK